MDSFGAGGGGVPTLFLEFEKRFRTRNRHLIDYLWPETTPDGTSIELFEGTLDFARHLDQSSKLSLETIGSYFHSSL